MERGGLPPLSNHPRRGIRETATTKFGAIRGTTRNRPQLQKVGIKWWVLAERDTWGFREGLKIFLPSGLSPSSPRPLPVLWTAIWITRMIRAEPRELKQFFEPGS